MYAYVGLAPEQQGCTPDCWEPRIRTSLTPVLGSGLSAAGVRMPGHGPQVSATRHSPQSHFPVPQPGLGVVSLVMGRR